ncbi:MAG: Nramp family divalent metal transporter [Pseudomonadales bacterium]
MSGTKASTGPGFVVAAAFIGPGTVTTCSLAGAGFGLTLLWVLLLAVLATVLLQEMSARLALASGAGLTEALTRLAPPWGRVIAWVAGLAVLLGVIAFEAGNLSGAGLGLAALSGTTAPPWTALTAISAALLLISGRYRLVEQVLMVAVALMALAFLATAWAVGPDWQSLARGLLVPQLPRDAALTALALVGTTIVPYNLYLHAAATREHWGGPADLGAARRDLIGAIALGGLISLAIVVTASATLGGARIGSAADMARQLEPLLGGWAGVSFGIGLATAGLTSAITAPLAAAYLCSGLMGRRPGLDTTLARGVALTCIVIGAALALTGIRPVRLIVFAQAANGLILPLITLALILALNDRRLGELANTWRGNVAGMAVVALCALLAVRTFVS